MLSGKTPFQSYSRVTSAATIMHRICEGEFSFTDSAWDLVSSQAKEVIQGLLTVDPQKRLTLHELRSRPWVRGDNLCIYSSTPLMTPDVLSSSSSSRAAESVLRVTFDAFRQASRAGFRLQDVSSAPLAQRRKQKKSSTEARSSSTLSTSSSCSSCERKNSSNSSSSVCVNPPNKSESSMKSLGLSPIKEYSQSWDVFSYPENKVKAYLSTLPADICDIKDSPRIPKIVVCDEEKGPTTRSRKRKLKTPHVDGAPFLFGSSDTQAAAKRVLLDKQKT